jgi:hypothetical protein
MSGVYTNALGWQISVYFGVFGLIFVWFNFDLMCCANFRDCCINFEIMWSNFGLLY